MYMCIYIYIYICTYTHMYTCICLFMLVFVITKCRRVESEGGMIRSETLIELKFLNSSFLSSNFSIRAF